MRLFWYLIQFLLWETQIRTVRGYDKINSDDSVKVKIGGCWEKPEKQDALILSLSGVAIYA